MKNKCLYFNFIILMKHKSYSKLNVEIFILLIQDLFNNILLKILIILYKYFSVSNNVKDFNMLL